jgi:hypothetical protein
MTNSYFSMVEHLMTNLHNKFHEFSMHQLTVIKFTKFQLEAQKEKGKILYHTVHLSHELCT